MTNFLGLVVKCLLILDPERAPNRSFVGGPKVHFTDQQESQEDILPIGNFERHDTPHPKPHSHMLKPKKQSIDGHVIPHDDGVGFNANSVDTIPNCDAYAMMFTKIICQSAELIG